MMGYVGPAWCPEQRCMKTSGNLAYRGVKRLVSRVRLQACFTLLEHRSERLYVRANSVSSRAESYA